MVGHGAEATPRKRTAKPREPLPVLGWREWVTFPELGLPPVKAKVDTGARSSAIHAFDVERFERDGKPWVRFKVHPVQRNEELTVQSEAPLLERRFVRDTSGRRTLRPVIVTHAELLGRRWPIELTLASRDEMGFRMLLGRQAVRRRFLVDPGRSFVGGKPVRTDSTPLGDTV